MSETSRRKLAWVVAGIWVLAAFSMLLAPSPSEWGAFGKKIGTMYYKIKPVLQPLAHVILMAICSFLLMHFFSSRPLVTALFYSIGIAVVFSVALEMLQSLLPAGFSRQCDPYDLLPSMAGSFFGGAAGACIRFRTSC